jgi:hypothetical protein
MRPISGVVGDMIKGGSTTRSGAFSGTTQPPLNRVLSTGTSVGYTALDFDSAKLGTNFNGAETQPKHVKLVFCVHAFDVRTSERLA